MDNNKDLGSVPRTKSSMVKLICSGIKDFFKDMQRCFKYPSHIHLRKRCVTVSSIYDYLFYEHTDASLVVYLHPALRYISTGSNGKVCNPIGLTFTKENRLIWPMEIKDIIVAKI